MRLRRRIAVEVAILGLAGGAFWVWLIPPRATEPPDAAFGRGDDGLWLSRRWLHEDLAAGELDALVARLREHGVSTVYPFLGPMDAEGQPGFRRDGVIQRYDRGRVVERAADFRHRAPEVRVRPWTGGVLDRDVRFDDGARIEGFLAHVELMTAVAGFDGIQLNVEPLPTGDEPFLALLRRVKERIGVGRTLSVAAYPPPTPLHPYPDVHWDPAYLARVCEVADELAVMMYDTALRQEWLYVRLMASWTETLADLPPPVEGGCEVRFGIPAYEDDVGWHDPGTEHVASALEGVRAGLARVVARRGSLPHHLRGIALYADWTMDPDEWALVDTRWRRAPAPGARGS